MSLWLWVSASAGVSLSVGKRKSVQRIPTFLEYSHHLFNDCLYEYVSAIRGRYSACIGFFTAWVGPRYPHPLSQLKELLDNSRAFAALPRVKYTPTFHLESISPAGHAKGTQWFYICDGNQRIGLIQTWTKEIEMFRFSPGGDGAAAKYEIPEIYH